MEKVIIIGSGPAALMLAAHLDETKFDVHIYEKNQAAGRKFLVAGDGGFNLTHSEDIQAFITRYTPDYFLRDALLQFTNEDLRGWLKKIGVPTYVGTSKRVFPEKGIKPIDVLNRIIAVLEKKNVQFHFSQEWCGWEKNELVFNAEEDHQEITDAAIVVFALGGASWKVTGSDGGWKQYFDEKKIVVNEFNPSNCSVKVNWDSRLIAEHEGKALKNISIRCAGEEKKGEVVITKFGLEGGAVYFHSPQIRKQLKENRIAFVSIDLRPDMPMETALSRMQQTKISSRSGMLRKEFGLSDTAVALLRSILSKEEFLDNDRLAFTLKNVPVGITGMALIDEAISTSGGIDLSEVNEHFELKKLPHHFAIGEMLDWDAPTGGYLLQASFSMGWRLAKYLNG